MYKIEFYQDKNGYSEVAEYIRELGKEAVKSKEGRINFNKVMAYMDELREKGTRVGEPITKHLEGEIWELRPLKNRFMYAYHEENKFIILNHFIKKTRKTPKREIIKAKRNLQDIRERECKKC